MKRCLLLPCRIYTLYIFRMKIPVFKSEDQEADWWYANRKEVERELRNAKPVTDASGKPMSVAEIVAAHVAEQNRMRLISLRLPVSDIDRAKKQASARGIGYQTLIRMIVHEALQDKKPRRATT